MSKPNESLQSVVVPSFNTPRTRAYSACGEPVIQGSVSGGVLHGSRSEARRRAHGFAGTGTMAALRPGMSVGQMICTSLFGSVWTIM